MMVILTDHQEILAELGEPHTIREFSEAACTVYYWRLSSKLWLILRVMQDSSCPYSELELVLRDKDST